MTTKTIVCLGVLITAIAFKFWLIDSMEIMDDEGGDQPNYVAQILVGGPSFFGPGTGLVGNAFRYLHIPFRDGIELAYLVASVLVIRSLFDWPVKSYLSLGLFLFVYFNPVAEELFSHILSDPVWLVDTMLGLSLFAIFVPARGRIKWLGLVLGATFVGLSAITRTTLVPLLASILLWALATSAIYWFKNRRNPFNFHVIGAGAVYLAVLMMTEYAACSYNSIYNGYFGLSVEDSREFLDFYMCLQSVGDATGDKYYPVDADRLNLVAQAGPVSATFVKLMGTDQNFRRISQEHFGKFDLALTWFVFPVFFNTLPNGNLHQGFAMFKAIENEVAVAVSEHRLKVRHILPLPDARIGIVLSATPEAIQTFHSLITIMPSKYAWAYGDEPQFKNNYFTAALTRRDVTPSPLRENIGIALCKIYAVIYWSMLYAMELSAVVCLTCGIYYRVWTSPFDLDFAAKLIFVIYFVVLFFWYVLFSASGLLATSRYMLYQNIMLPLLLAFFLRTAWQIFRSHRDDLPSPDADNTATK